MSQSAIGRSSGREPQMFGRYRLRGRLAAGGMAEVWAAQLLAPGGFCKAMVIKRVLPEMAQNPAFLKMLMTEARVAARLSHTNICAVFELGEVDGEYYIAMEYLRGAPLTELLRAGGALPVAAAAAIVAQACDGLHYAHEQRDGSGHLLGLVHRDVSPHNLFVTVDGIVKVLDFGIAKVDDGISERTEAGKVKGKLAYMSPEQLAAEELDRRSDVWSLGVVLWELLTGRRLFSGGGPAATVDAIRNARVPPLSTTGVAVPALDDVLARAMCASREWRYASAAELRKAIVDAIAPGAPAGTDELSRILWARCGEQVRANDRRFEDEDEPALGAEPVVERLPLRAEETQPSVPSDGRWSAEELGGAAAPAAATSPEVEVVVGTDPDPDEPPTVVTGTTSGQLVAPAPAVGPAIHGGSEVAILVGDGLASRRRPRTTWIAAAVVASLVIGVSVGIAVRGSGGGEPPAAAAVGDTRSAAVPDTAAVPDAAAVPDTAAVPDAGAVAVAAAAPDAAPAPRATRPIKKKDPPPRAPPPRPTPAKPGKLYVDARPWATIYVDGKKLGPTPIVGHSLPAGPHTIKAVTEDGRTKTLRVDIPAGGELRRKVLW